MHVTPAIDDLYQLITLEEVGSGGCSVFSIEWIILFLLPFSRESFGFPQKCDGWTDGVWPCIFFPHAFHLPLSCFIHSICTVLSMEHAQ